MPSTFSARPLNFSQNRCRLMPGIRQRAGCHMRRPRAARGLRRRPARGRCHLLANCCRSKKRWHDADTRLSLEDLRVVLQRWS